MASISGCTGHGPQSLPAPSWSTQIHTLRSPVNDLVYPPFLRNEPTTLSGVGAALDLRRLLLDDEPQVSPARQRVDTLRAEALAVSPLYGRSWLAVLARAGATNAVNPGDRAAVQRMRHPAGYYQDPADRAPTPRSRLADTRTALALLHDLSDLLDDGPGDHADHAAHAAHAATGGAVTGTVPVDGSALPHHASTLGWLRGTCPFVTGADEIADCIESLRSIGAPAADLRALPVPPLPPPVTSTGSTESRRTAVAATYGYVRWAELTDHATPLDRATWRAILDANADDVDFEYLRRLTVIARAAGVPVADLGAVRRRLTANTLPDGLARDEHDYLGDVTSTFYALAIAALHGADTTDDGLVTALDSDLSTDHAQDAIPAIVRLAARHLAARHSAARMPSSAEVATACRDARPALGSLTPSSASGWLLVTRACLAAGVSPPPPPPVAPWPAQDPEHVTAAAAALLVLRATGAPDADSFSRSLGDLHAWVANPQRFPNLHTYAVVTSAYVREGGRLDPELTRTIRATLDAAQGCPGLPDLYRAEASEGCDLATSYTATSLRLLVQDDPEAAARSRQLSIP